MGFTTWYLAMRTGDDFFDDDVAALVAGDDKSMLSEKAQQLWESEK